MQLLVFLMESHLHFLSGQSEQTNGQGMLLALRHDGHHCVLVRRSHTRARRRQTRAHNVRTAEDEPDGALVHLLHGHKVGELVQQAQGGHPGTVAMAEEHLLTGSVQQ